MRYASYLQSALEKMKNARGTPFSCPGTVIAADDDELANNASFGASSFGARCVPGMHLLTGLIFGSLLGQVLCQQFRCRKMIDG